MIDPNWFYSSSAQCAAAIVGLMGAFLVTKLINQKSLVNQLNNEISDYENKIKLISKDIASRTEFIKNFDFEKDCKNVNKFLDDFKLYIDPTAPFSLEKIYEIAQKDDDVKNISIEVFEHEYNEDYLAKVREAHEKLVDKFLKSLEKEPIDRYKLSDAQFLYNDNENDTEHEEYQLMNWSIFRKKYEEYIKMKMNKNFPSVYSNEDIDQESNVSTTNADFIENERINFKKCLNYKDEIDTKKTELLYYSKIIQEKQNLLGFNNEIPGLKNTFILLFAFSVLGVFLPLFMLLFDDNTMIEYRPHTLILMFIGWLLIVRHLGLEIRGLMRQLIR
jgi:hypothetical protein